jgi:hypothetical protein
VAQLGARFHGMEEVDGSNPSRSTKSLTITAVTSSHQADGCLDSLREYSHSHQFKFILLRVFQQRSEILDLRPLLFGGKA